MLFSLANQVEQRWLGILGSLQGRQSVGGMWFIHVKDADSLPSLTPLLSSPPPLNAVVIAGVLKCMDLVRDETWIRRFFSAAKTKVCSLCKLPHSSRPQKSCPKGVGRMMRIPDPWGHTGFLLKDTFRHKLMETEVLPSLILTFGRCGTIFTTGIAELFDSGFTVAHASVAPVRLWSRNCVRDIRMSSVRCQGGRFWMRRKSIKSARGRRRWDCGGNRLHPSDWVCRSPNTNYGEKNTYVLLPFF
jgi:hypothetical protein